MTKQQDIWQETYNIVLRETKDPERAATAADAAVARFNQHDKVPMPSGG